MTFHAPLIIDIAGTSLTAVDRKRLKHPLVGGMILFARNWQNREQLTALCRDIKKVRADLLICVDHEGGRVQRFKTDGFTHLPAMAQLGKLWRQKASNSSPQLQAMQCATAMGYVLAAELRACDIDFSFTPVLDLDHGESGVIGDRALARDPRVVSLLARSLMHGLLLAGMGNCGKHFPGHGAVKADSHTDIPVDRRGLKTILSDDAAPYPWLGSVLTAVMPAHVIYSRVDARPAGFSKRWLQDILRGQMGFQGAIFSDDLSMAGARQAPRGRAPPPRPRGWPSWRRHIRHCAAAPVRFAPRNSPARMAPAWCWRREPAAGGYGQAWCSRPEKGCEKMQGTPFRAPP